MVYHTIFFIETKDGSTVVEISGINSAFDDIYQNEKKKIYYTVKFTQYSKKIPLVFLCGKFINPTKFS